MINRDYHHHRLDDALADAERLIGLVRMDGTPQYTRFVTGFGVIRTELFEMLEKYDLEPAYELNNPGAIVVTIE